MTNLTAAGLSETEAKCYEALLTKKAWKPADLAKNVNETRTNCYKILDKLVLLGLAERFDKDKKLHYQATNPSVLLDLARATRASREEAEKELEISASKLISQYAQVHEQPAVRYYQGKSALRDIFEDQIKTGQPICFMHTIAGIDYYGYDEMHNLRMLAVDAGIPRRALTPDTPLATNDYIKTDALFKLKRTWLGEDDYTAPVEWGVYGDKLYLISYGVEALGIVIESPQIAAAFKQVFSLLERGLKALPDYNSLPKLAQHKAKVRGR